MKSTSSLFRFGPNELDVLAFELRRSGKRIRISRSLLELLQLLLEHRGNLVTRDDIAARLWTDPQMVDVVQGINTAVNRLRAALNDSSSKPRYIETVVGKGYRFIGSVELQEASTPKADAGLKAEVIAPLAYATQVPLLGAPSPMDPLSLTNRSKRKWLVGIAALAVTFLGLTVFSRQSKSKFVVTASPQMEEQAFRQLTMNDSATSIEASAISPDGKLLAYAVDHSVFLRVVQSGDESLLPSPPELRIDRVSWFSDDLRLAVSGYSSNSHKAEIWVVFITGGSPRLFQEGGRNGTPSPNGNWIAYTGPEDKAIWIEEASGGNPRVLVSGGQGERFPYVFWSVDGGRVTYQREQYSPENSPISTPDLELESNYKRYYESTDVRIGKLTASVADLRFDSACLLSNSRMLYLRWGDTSHRQWYQLWEVETDPASGQFLSPPQLIKTFKSQKAFSVSASANGGQTALVLESHHPSIYVGDLQGSPPQLLKVRKLTHDLRSDYPHDWTPQSQSVLFESNRSGTFQIYQQHLDSEIADQVTFSPFNSVLPQYAPGAQWILFARSTVPPGTHNMKSTLALYRTPFTGGNVEQVPIGKMLDEFECPSTGKGTCVLRETLAHKQLVYYALDPIKGKGEELGRTRWVPPVLNDWSLSPDGTSVAFPLHDIASRTIRIVPLAGSGLKNERSITVNSLGYLQGVHWAANGQGFFARSDTDAGSDLIYSDLSGQVKVLRHSIAQLYGVPSPDGKKLAFVENSVDSNVWTHEK